MPELLVEDHLQDRGPRTQSGMEGEGQERKGRVLLSLSLDSGWNYTQLLAVRAREMGQLIKSLVCKHKEVTSDPWQPHKASHGDTICCSSAGEGQR